MDKVLNFKQKKKPFGEKNEISKNKLQITNNSQIPTTND